MNKSVIVAGALAIMVAVTMMFGNPQWSSFIWYFQSQVLCRKLEAPPLYTGLWIEWRGAYSWHDMWEGGMNRETMFRNGVRDGIDNTYYPDGAIEYGRCYKNGKEHGKFIDCSDPGKIWSVMEYQEGIEVKRSRYEDGRLDYVETNRADDRRYIEYYPNGSLKRETFYYEPGRKWCGTKRYAEDGTLTFHSYLEFGKEVVVVNRAQ